MCKTGWARGELGDFRKHVIEKHHKIMSKHLLMNQANVKFMAYGECVICQKSVASCEGIHFLCHMCEFVTHTARFLQNHLKVIHGSNEIVMDRISNHVSELRLTEFGLQKR